LCSYNTRMFTWDEAKRKENLQKHGIDFAGRQDNLHQLHGHR
jgi:uncharacterized DUF497 family protein